MFSLESLLAFLWFAFLFCIFWNFALELAPFVTVMYRIANREVKYLLDFIIRMCCFWQASYWSSHFSVAFLCRLFSAIQVCFSFYMIKLVQLHCECVLIMFTHLYPVAFAYSVLASRTFFPGAVLCDKYRCFLTVLVHLAPYPQML